LSPVLHGCKKHYVGDIESRLRRACYSFPVILAFLSLFCSVHKPFVC
jgi:hypothetical protein